MPVEGARKAESTENSSAGVSAGPEVHRGCRGEAGEPTFPCGESKVAWRDFVRKIELEMIS